MYKLENGYPVPFTSKYIKMGGMIYANPTEEQLINAGYMYLIETEMPSSKGDGYFVDEYEIINNQIVQKWVFCEYEDFDEANI